MSKSHKKDWRSLTPEPKLLTSTKLHSIVKWKIQRLCLLYGHTITQKKEKIQQNVNSGYLLSVVSRSEWDEYEHISLLVRKMQTCK